MTCGTDFFTKGERIFYKKKGLQTPKRCKSCRDNRRAHVHCNLRLKFPSKFPNLYIVYKIDLA
ncbi:MAG TPA: zinc-ribbon domain containing protein [Pseudogracilibacillus sp.]|nr:zinc-ribbon domain containing protein [Pseudogracilibacillus sp.]